MAMTRVLHEGWGAGPVVVLVVHIHVKQNIWVPGLWLSTASTAIHWSLKGAFYTIHHFTRIPESIVMACQSVCFQYYFR